MRTPTTAVIVTALAAIGISAAQAQAPQERLYSMSTDAIARHLAQDVIRIEVCRLPARPLPFSPLRLKAFDEMVVREEAKLDRALADHGDEVICACLSAGRVSCP